MQDFFVCQVRDAATGLYRVPYYVVSLGEATRQFSDVVSDPAMGMFFNHPGDFELFHVGTWNDKSGVFTALDAPESLGRGSDLKRVGATVASATTPPLDQGGAMDGGTKRGRTGRRRTRSKK